jgi:transglutaminase-like putative cysteine protease
MKRYASFLLLVGLALPLAVRAQAPGPKLVLETYQAAYLEGIKAGYVHTTVHEVERDGKKLYRTTRDLRLSIRRYHSVVPVRMELGSDETADGKAVALSFTQFVDKGGRLTQTGTVEGGQLTVRTPRGPLPRKLPWKAEALGLYKQDLLYKERKVKPGDSFSFLSYELALLAPLTMRVKVKDEEKVDVLEAATEKGKTVVRRVPKKLLRVETLPDKVTVGENTIQLPRQLTWLDKDRLPVRYQAEVPGLGTLTLYQTTKAVATEPGLAPEQLPDLGLNSIVSVAKVIERPYETRSASYRITVKGDDDPSTTFARDGRQQVRNAKGASFELHVQADTAPGKEKAPDKHFLESSYFLDSDHFLIKSWAKHLTKGEAKDLAKARRIEKWVHDNMKGSNAVGFATASQVIKDRTGDCRQHAMLTAALCRAAGVPARTAVGLIYVHEPGRKPVLIFHMWTEVWADGRWAGLDATLGRGGISACHLKVADHSWRDTQTLAPLLPVARVLGKIDVEVLEAR